MTFAAQPVDIQLSEVEMMQASISGVMRQIESVRNKRRYKYGAEKGQRDWQYHIEGALGEMAVAKYLDVYWGGTVNGFKQIPDVDLFEVRTRSKHKYDLMIRPDEPKDRRYILVTGFNGEYKIWGWKWGRTAMTKPYFRFINNDRPPAYFVPKKDLDPMESIYF